MNERWVCKRCFADNEDGQRACVRCGSERGAEAAPVDQPAWAAHGGPAAAAQQPLWQKLLRFWWIPLVAIALLVGYLQAAKRGDDGQLASAGTLAVTDLRIGDCFNSEEEEITDVDGVPCTEPHTYEVFASGDYGGAGDPYPSTIEFDAAFAAVCQGEFEPYVGAPWETSMIFANMITPSTESWEEGDREFTCVLVEPVDPSDAASEYVVHTESLRGAAR